MKRKKNEAGRWSHEMSERDVFFISRCVFVSQGIVGDSFEGLIFDGRCRRQSGIRLTNRVSTRWLSKLFDQVIFAGCSTTAVVVVVVTTLLGRCILYNQSLLYDYIMMCASKGFALG